MEHGGPSKKTKYIYWISTTIFAAMMLSAAFAYLTTEAMKENFAHLGYPPYFRVELAVAKILGAFTLLLRVSPGLKSWAYAGFTFTLISAAIAHFAVGDSFTKIVTPLLILVILLISRFTYGKVKGYGV